MLKNKIIVRKIRNIIILFMVLMIMIGAYSNIRRSRAEDVLLIMATAIDNYGYLENEEIELEAKAIAEDLYEVELPETVNTKKYNEIVKLTLDDPKTEVESEKAELENALTENSISNEETNTVENDEPEETINEETTVEEPTTNTEEPTEETTGETINEETPIEDNVIEIVDNKIYLTQEQIDTKVINMEVIYDSALIEVAEDETTTRKLLAEMTEEERLQANILKETELLYNRILRYEDEENAKLVEVKGYLPKDIKLEVEGVTQEQLTEIFGETKIDVAYDIKLIREAIVYVPVDEANPDSELEEIIEKIEIDPKNYGENCEVLIKDVNIQKESSVYHVKENNTYEPVIIKQNEDESVTFNTDTFSIYAVTTETGIMARGLVGGNEYVNFSANVSPGVWTQSVTGSATAVGEGVYIKGVEFMSSSSGLASDNGSTSDTVSSTGTWYLRVRYGIEVDGAQSAANYYTGLESGFKVDATDPTTPSLSVSPSGATSSWTTGTVQVTASSSDAHSGLDRYEWSLNDGSWTDASGESAWNDIDITSSGEHKVEFRAVDNVGNVSSTKSTTVKVDNSKPTVELAENSGDWAKSHSVKVTVKDAHSGLATGGTLRYGWSTSDSTAPSSWTEVTLTNSSGASSTSFTAKGSGLTGQYYLWVDSQSVKDKVGNEKTGNTISTGKFKFDNTNPQNVSLSPSSEPTWAKEHTVTGTIRDAHSGLADGNKILFQWSTSATAPAEFGGTRTPSYNEGDKTATFEMKKTKDSGKYYLYIKPDTYKDVAGNSNSTVISGGEYWFDNTAPSVSYSHTTGWAKSHTATVNLNDAHSGLATGASVQYAWSTDGANAPGSWSAASIPSYSAGSNTVSLNITGSGYNGTYYLWIKSGTLKDQVRNESTLGATAIGPFYFDNTPPVNMTLSPNSNTTWAKSHSVTVTMGDTLSGLSTSNVIQYGWSSSLTTAPSSYSTASLNYASGATSATFTASGAGDTGKYYLWVKPTSYYDVAGNQNTTTVKSTGQFYLDNTAPSVQYSNTGDTTWRQSHNVRLTLSDAHSGLAAGVSVKYKWSTSNTTAPTEWSTAGLPSYTAGTNSAVSVDITGSGYTGVYYLWIQHSSIKDLVGNEYEKPANLTMPLGPFYFDNTIPTMKIDGGSIQNGITQNALLGAYEAYNNTGTGSHNSSATTWVDLAGGDNNGTINGATFQNEEYLSFDGVDDYVSLGQMNFSEQVTLEAIIVPKAITSEETVIIANFENGGAGLAMRNGQPFMTVYINSSYIYATSSETLELGQKYHIVGTYDGTSIKLYVNGVLKAEVAVTGTLGQPEGTPMMIGANPPKEGTGNGIIGFAKMDVYEARIYDKALTMEEVLANKEAASNRPRAWAKEHSVTVTLNDAHSGLYTGNSIRYGWTSHIDNPPASYKTAAISYAGDGHTATFTATGVNDSTGEYYLTGKYYLYMDPTTFRDNAGNSNLSDVRSSDTYWFDNKGPVWTISNLNKDAANRFISLNLLGTDEHSGYASNSLKPEDISVWVDGVEVKSITKSLSKGTETGSGVLYGLSLANFEEALRQEGKLYKEWSGNVVIKIAGETIVDKLGNESEEHQLSLGHTDFIKPELTYEYLDTDINYKDKTVQMAFTVTDKYFNENTLTIDDLTIKIDDYQLTDEDYESATNPTGVKRNLQIEQITEIRNSEEVTIGYKYTLILSQLEQAEIKNGKYLDYSGVITLGIPGGVFSDTSGNTNNAQTITLGLDLIEITGPSSSIYVPSGYSYVEGDFETGYVIEDAKGNQYVWVEVPKTEEIYQTAGLDITNFTDAEFDLIENDLHTYTATYRNGTAYVDEYSGNDASVGLTESQYNTQKKKMLKSIYKNGGFYVGRYETGIDYSEGPRTASGGATQTPVIKQNAYPYNFVTTNQARSLSESFASNGYSSSLMFGVQWDLVLKYLETKGATQVELNGDSSEWGNYHDNIWNITNTNAKYYINDTWAEAANAKKTENTSILLTTGASETFSKQNIYDLAGNVYATTLEFSSDSSYPCAFRGGYYGLFGSDNPASSRFYDSTSFSELRGGFRVALYKDEGAGADSYSTEPTYIPEGYSHVEGTSMETGYVVKDGQGNEYVWVDVPKTTAVYQTAGLDIKTFTDAEFDLIESDLQTYTSVYRKNGAGSGGTTLLDEWVSDALSTMSSNDYYVQKKKMLKSIYKNGGFYVGRYETGIEDSQPDVVDTTIEARTAGGDTTQTPVIKQNAYPYNFVTNTQAQSLASSFASSGYSTSLMFGVQWDLIMKYLETKGASNAELDTSSIEWGNYLMGSYNITNEKAKYYTHASGWVEGAYGSKPSGSSIILSTGASDTFSKQNIYDLAGNLWTYTLDVSAGSGSVGIRGGCFSNTDTGYPANVRWNANPGQAFNNVGFRVSLYKDEGIGTESDSTEPTYIPEGYSHVEGTSMETGYVVKDTLGNEYVWVEVPRTATVYPTAGLNITSFTEAEYDLIENDLNTYTSDYWYGYDEYYSGTITGLTESDYNIQKKKMLKSIYKNGGFYIGRYETGIENSYRTAAGNTTQAPVIKANAYPYNFVTLSQSQSIASSFASGGYTSSLMFGVQWNLVVKYLETKGVTQAEISEDSGEWGNYYKHSYTITNENAKYSVAGVNEYVSATNKTIDTSTWVILTTGSTEQFKKQNIYDFAGNLWEWSLATARVTSDVARGASAYNESPVSVAGYTNRNSGYADGAHGIRVSLYKDEGTGTEATEPTYIPEGYSHVEGTDMDSGYVVKDASGNEYVWIEVPKTSAVYPTAGIGITEFTTAEYEAIENDLHTYTSVYRNGTAYTDTWSSENATGMTENEYNAQKNKMLKSIYINGGFYVGRYETGITNAPRTAAGNVTQSPTIRANAYPYSYVTKVQAQELSESFASNGYSSSLMFGVQWDLVLKYLESKGATQNELNLDSTEWGNYANNLWNITNTNAKYSTDTIDAVNWVNGAYGEKTEQLSVPLSTGASDTFSKQNIYDLAGNVHEWTLEYTNSTQNSCAIRGGSSNNLGGDGTAGGTGSGAPASLRYSYGSSETYSAFSYIGFRVALYRDESTAEPGYIPEGYSHVEGTSMETGYVIKDSSGNEYVWVEVPRTAEVYPTAGSNISLFTATEYAAIENDLKTYTATYRNGTHYVDEYFSDETTGLTKAEYTQQKQKMLKSVYKNEGFYVGRYETGTETARTEAGEATQSPVIKQNAYPYNYVTNSQAQALSESFSSEGYTSSLMFGVQWDLVLKYLESKGTAQSQLTEDSTSWGNYYYGTYNISNANAKYAIVSNGELSAWSQATSYSKASGAAAFFTTGSSEQFKKQNIYDLAGNMVEWTLETSGNSELPCAYRGGGYGTGTTDESPVSYRSVNNATRAFRSNGFRTALYKDEISDEPTYVPSESEGYTHVEGTSMSSGYVIKDASGNEFVWVEVPRTEAVYPTAGLNITQFSDADYAKIENDLKTYTATYRNGTAYTDTWSSEAATGMTQNEYNIQKRKMLKSIYKNGGFYVGRYETGTETARTAAGETTQTPVIKQNVYPYTYITTSQSQSLASSFATEGLTSSLMFGIQWDLMMKYLENKGIPQDKLTQTSDSTSLGNYSNNLYNITNTNSKYTTTNVTTWTEGAYGEKTASTAVLLTTGASDTFSLQNIYDLAGNLTESTLEYTNSSEKPNAYRGGYFVATGSEQPVGGRAVSLITNTGQGTGFRVALYKDEGLGVDDGLVADVVDPFWRVENVQKDVAGQRVTAELIGTDKYFKEANLTAENIQVIVDGTNITELGYGTITLSEPTELTEVRDGATTQYGLKYTITIENWEEASTRDGNPYKEWSGNTQLVIKEGTMTDQYKNKSKEQTLSLGQVDVIRPEVLYNDSETVIDYATKQVTVNFTVVDKYFNAGALTIDDLTIYVDGENVSQISSVTKTLTESANPIQATVNGETKTVGKSYTLLLENLEQNPNDGFNYSGVVTIVINPKISDTSGNLNNTSTMTIGIDGVRVPGTESTEPYIPEDFNYVQGGSDTGMVIQDSVGNEFVWVEVPKTEEVYETAGLNITAFTDAEYTKIENDLHTYTTVYRNGTSYTDTWSSEAATGLTETEYNTQKKKMLKSIYTYGGFYVGRYETGTATARTSSSAELTTPIVQQNAYPYNYVTNAQAQELSESFASGEYTSSLMFGVQWDLVLKYFETKGVATQADLTSDSTSWGNYYNNVWSVESTTAKYSTDYGATYTSTPYEKTGNATVFLTTGADSSFSKMGIYDIAGNAWEWTLEYTSNSSYPSAFRSGSCFDDGYDYPASDRAGNNAAVSDPFFGFRPSLYKDPDVVTNANEPSYIPEGYSHLEGTDMDTGYVVKDSSGNEFVWVEVPQTAEVYPTAGLNITAFTDTEYTAIENDLHTYTTVYRNGTSYTDTWSSEAATGLTETEYNTQKKKMLKSIYTYGGFYVGRYETGTATARTSSSAELTTPVVQQNVYPYNYVTNAQAQELSESFASGEYTSSLMFGVQWDLVLKYLETKGATQDELNSDSTSWGNYYNNLWNVTNTSSKYSTDFGSTWTVGAYGEKLVEKEILLSTGADSSFSKMGIYDFAGNVEEWTLEYTSSSGTPCAHRSGSYYGEGWLRPASFRLPYSVR